MLETDDNEVAIVKAIFLALLFNMELPQATSSSVLVHITDMMDDVPQNNETNKCSKPGTFHKIKCMTGINPEDLTGIVPNPSLSVESVKGNM